MPRCKSCPDPNKGKCRTCKGRGKVDGFAREKNCGTCGGDGNCSSCDGTGYVSVFR